MEKSTILLFDGNALLHRAWHAIPPLRAPGGTLVNAVYGFFVTFLSAIKQFNPGYAVVTFDVKGGTFRDEMFADYKAKRVKPPQELYDQIPLIKDILNTFEVPILSKKGFEADDIIGTLVTKIHNAPVGNSPNIIIVTGDQDAIQLIDSSTNVYAMKKGLNDTVLLDIPAVNAKYGFNPDKMVDYKALRGDPSDNIPGVSGIGEKTATQLIQKFGSLEDIYRQLGKVDPKVASKLQADEANAKLSKQLATIKRDVEIEFDLEKSRLHNFDQGAVEQKLLKLGFRSLISRLPNSNRPTQLPKQARLL